MISERLLKFKFEVVQIHHFSMIIFNPILQFNLAKIMPQ